jgi:hypothetical protein
MDRPADRGGISGGHGAALPPARPRWRLRGRVQQPHSRAWHRRGQDRGAVSLAESIRGAPRGLRSPRLPRPRHRPRRSPLAGNPQGVLRVLLPRAHAPLARQGRAGPTTSPATQRRLVGTRPARLSFEPHPHEPFCLRLFSTLKAKRSVHSVVPGSDSAILGLLLSSMIGTAATSLSSVSVIGNAQRIRMARLVTAARPTVAAGSVRRSGVLWGPLSAVFEDGAMDVIRGADHTPLFLHDPPRRLSARDFAPGSSWS